MVRPDTTITVNFGDVMQKDEKVVIVLLFMVVASIAVLYAMAGSGDLSDDPDNSGYSDYSDSSDVGDRVIVHAKVLSKRMTNTGGHLSLIVEPESVRSPLTVFIVNNAGAEDINKEVTVGDMLVVRGRVDDYKGTREVVVENRRDVSKDS